MREYSQTLKGREQLAVEEFALSLESIPKILAENSGLDPIDILTELKAQHDAGNMHAGIVVGSKGEVKNAFEAGVIEPLRIKTQAITSASEVATMILRIDDVVAAGKSSSGNASWNGRNARYGVKNVQQRSRRRRLR